MKKVILGMSGGVDSSVAALLLQRQGFEVIGFMMNCDPFGKSKLPSTIDWQKEERDLRAICSKLGIELHVHDCEVGYGKKVIGRMIKDYSRGLTPNPDTLCNKIGKFPKMLKLAKEIGADFIATGHYARVRRGKEGFELLMGVDKNKDQSYFLSDMNQRTLSKTLFPIGVLTKTQVREIARRAGFGNWNKKSSRGICYLGKIDVKEFLKSRIPSKVGKVILPSGEIVGEHPGIFYFTIGERVGEKSGVKIDRKKVGSGEKLYVAAKLKGNKLMVAFSEDDALKTRKVYVKGFRMINPRAELPLKVRARIRHLGEMHSGKLRKSDGKWIFEFSRGVEGVAPGQIIAFYSGERMVASGEIRSA